MSLSSNYDFYTSSGQEFFSSVLSAEQTALSDPRSSLFYSRYSLEQAIKWLYQVDKSLSRPYSDNLMALIHEPTFKQNLSQHPHLFPKILGIVKLGNRAVHDSRPITSRESVFAVKELWHFFVWLYATYTPADKQVKIPAFDESLLNKQATPDHATSAAELKKLQDELAAKDAAAEEAKQDNQNLATELHRLREELAKIKEVNETKPDTHDYNETDTREFFIDLLLRESGWDPNARNVREYEVEGMPYDSNQGFCDYVLWGDNGLPLAVVEAKRTRISPESGRKQASLYADCLEKKFKQRPIIFYTNGYSHFIWDDLVYPPREVQGFYTKAELQTLIHRREDRKPLRSLTVNEEIAGRYYQVEAIKSVCSHLEKKERRALIVMATGAGKTRTTIALADALLRYNWAKRVLFLADRIALVEQACGAFRHHLPNASIVDLTRDKENTNSRIMVSTYPTMMGLIDDIKRGQKRFGPGYFDLIIIDEAHRSVYKKYGAIFEYFDSLLLGLTATPRDESDRDTYRLFELQPGVPTYYYELEQAVRDGYLVPPKGLSVSLNLPSRGLKYTELQQGEKEQYEELFYDDEVDQIPTEIEGSAFNQWLFNKETVDNVLRTLMERGIKIEGGDKLGKTIVFARSHNHAEFILKRFNKHYPSYAGHFAAVIDNHIRNVSSIRRDFCKSASMPQIAISVDMLDTGVDIPEVVNLVFFKPVYSKVKFLQMMGRGTRLCPDLFGPGQDKQHFLAFDFCGNFEYFETNPDGLDGVATSGLTEKVFNRRLELAALLKASEEKQDRKLRTELLDRLHAEVTSMNTDNFIVRTRREHVERFKNRGAWDKLSEHDIGIVSQNLASLPNEMPDEEENAKRFDLLMFNLSLYLIKGDRRFEKFGKAVKRMMRQLAEKATIPMVKKEISLIEALQKDEYWKEATVTGLDEVRKRLRDLIQFIDPDGREIIYSDFQDQIMRIGLVDNIMGLHLDLPDYREKVHQFIKTQEDTLVINKLKRNVAVTRTDLDHLEQMLFSSYPIESKERFEKAFGHQEHIGVFIRRLIGLDRSAAKDAFTGFIQNRQLNPLQIRFVDQIINFLTQNGVMEVDALYDRPFTDLHDGGLDGVFPDGDADKIVALVKLIEKNAIAA